MSKFALRRVTLAMLAVPLALGLASCGKDNGDKAAGTGEPIARIAAPAGKAWSDVVVKTSEGGYRMGNPDAPIKLVEFASLTCPHCAEFAEKSTAELRDNFVASGRVSFELRNFVRDPIDIVAAQLTRCGTPESFFPLSEQTMANQKAMFEKIQAAGDPAFKAAVSQPDKLRGGAIAALAGLDQFFAARGIARDQAAACLANTAEAQALAKRTQDQAEQYDITGTPTFLVNGTKFEGNTWEEVKAELERLGAR